MLGSEVNPEIDVILSVFLEASMFAVYCNLSCIMTRQNEVEPDFGRGDIYQLIGSFQTDSSCSGCEETSTCLMERNDGRRRISRRISSISHLRRQHFPIDEEHPRRSSTIMRHPVANSSSTQSVNPRERPADSLRKQTHKQRKAFL